MDHNLKPKLVSKLLKKEGEEGFSLIELVLVVSVLTILGSIGLPFFLDFINQAIFSATKASLTQSYIGCKYKSDQGPQGPFIPGVVFQSTNCASEMTAIINSQCTLSLNMSTGSRTGWNDSYNGCVFSSNGNGNGNGNQDEDLTQKKLSINEFIDVYEEAINSGIVEGPYFIKDDSVYVVVNGPTWEEAESNANKLGGHLATINSKEENQWIVDKFREWVRFNGKKGDDSGDWQYTPRAYIGLNDKDSEGECNFFA